MTAAPPRLLQADATRRAARPVAKASSLRRNKPVAHAVRTQLTDPERGHALVVFVALLARVVPHDEIAATLACRALHDLFAIDELDRHFLALAQRRLVFRDCTNRYRTNLSAFRRTRLRQTQNDGA